jgi:hypothetical protein
MKVLLYVNDPGMEHYVNLPITVTQDIDYYCTTTEFDKKIAFCNERFIGRLNRNIEVADHLKPVSDLVVFELGEMMYTEVIDNTIDSNVYYLIPGFLNKYDPAQFIFMPNFFIEMSTFYNRHHLLHVLDRLTPYTVKPYYFDALLGTKKTHRDFIYQSYLTAGLENKILMNYRTTDIVEDRSVPLADNHQYFWEPGTTDAESVTYSGHMVKFYNLDMPASSVVPVQSVYNQSAYSIVAETAYDPGSPVFYTEKTVKPILARRLFIVFTAKNFLTGLRQAGFQTFDTVIDESYDLIDNDHERWTAAFEQVKYLCQQDQATVLAKIQGIVDHNYQVLTTTNWHGQAIQDLAKLVESKLH